MDPQLSLRRLEIFRLVVRERSITRAADLLMVAQPAVSSQIKALETWLGGAKLFVRVGNRLTLTEAGRRVDVWARDVLAGAAEVRRDVADLEDGVAGHVEVAASMAVGSYLIPPLLAEFVRERPQVELNVQVLLPDGAVAAVESGEVDFAVISWDERELPDTVSTVLLRHEPMRLYVGPDLLPHGTRLSIEEAMDLPFVGVPRDSSPWRELHRQLRRVTAKEPSYVVRFGHAEPIKREASRHGWAILMPRYLVEAEVAEGTLHEIDVPGLELSERIILIWRKAKLFAPAQQAVFDALRSSLQHDPDSTGTPVPPA
jgi:DNA-binding transcriptional LysR family regulator